MEESLSFPPIEPSYFDLIVIGTGLPESILASAAASAGKAVLHLDPNPFYGSHSASLSLDDFVHFLKSQSESQTQSQSLSQISVGDGDGVYIPLLIRQLYSDVEINSSSTIIEISRKFNLDLSGPRVMLCSDSMIDLILRTNINQYMEFKSVEACFLSDAEGKMENVPDSRSAIFKNRSLSLPEKNQLMKFFKLVQGHFANGSEADKICDGDLGSPFVDFLTKMGLSEKLKSIILYTIVMADYDQRNFEVCKDVMDTQSGIIALALYHSSIGRFSNANGAIIYPIYGQGEVPQAFCRRAAVKGCIYVLRMPVSSLLVDKDGDAYKGVKLVTGQELLSSQLILAPHFTISPSLAPSEQAHDAKEKVTRGICIAKNSLKSGVANCLVFFPPRSLYPEQITTVRVLQLNSNVSTCPPGMFVTYLSAKCGNAAEGKNILNEAINALFCVAETKENENVYELAQGKPCLLWSAMYIQELTKFEGAFHSITYTPMPDEHLHYNNLIDATKKIFQEIYPNEEFFPKIDGDACDDD